LPAEKGNGRSRQERIHAEPSFQFSGEKDFSAGDCQLFFSARNYFQRRNLTANALSGKRKEEARFFLAFLSVFQKDLHDADFLLFLLAGDRHADPDFREAMKGRKEIRAVILLAFRFRHHRRVDRQRRLFRRAAGSRRPAEILCCDGELDASDFQPLERRGSEFADMRRAPPFLS
jgi:hypothetical protein